MSLDRLWNFKESFKRDIENRDKEINETTYKSERPVENSNTYSKPVANIPVSTALSTPVDSDYILPAPLTTEEPQDRVGIADLKLGDKLELTNDKIVYFIKIMSPRSIWVTDKEEDRYNASSNGYSLYVQLRDMFDVVEVSLSDKHTGTKERLSEEFKTLRSDSDIKNLASFFTQRLPITVDILGDAGLGIYYKDKLGNSNMQMSFPTPVQRDTFANTLVTSNKMVKCKSSDPQSKAKTTYKSTIVKENLSSDVPVAGDIMNQLSSLVTGQPLMINDKRYYFLNLIGTNLAVTSNLNSDEEVDIDLSQIFKVADIQDGIKMVGESKSFVSNSSAINEDSFSKWFATLVTEKGFELDDDVPNIKPDEFYGNVMGITYASVIEFCSKLPKKDQDNIKNTLVKIDFKNGDINHFISYLASGMLRFTMGK